ncbi:hypothetical protein [Marinithermus hydrothermalis]|uniref:Uncharacterized protein n=1 Tax=Marinithermus hydrothermalis (strain DSM 14884 / JCM 11576 / T1) TaxID=869210 RepID=F2NPN7_MARHT|nr:hypothetical protein [Marinithermus hydrothermalis]AEB12538.1 hypothetical protein Marky_1806 [Marinithermus hydrothermalis DSM 14884]
MAALHLTRESSPEGLPPEVCREVRAWLEAHEVNELVLDLTAEGFGVWIDPEPDAIPVGLVPLEALRNPRALVACLEEAYRVYLSGLNSSD